MLETWRWIWGKLTGQEQTGEGDDVELLDGHVIVVHEQVQQVDGQVARRGTQLVAVAQDGQQVREVAPHADLRRVGPVDRQLQLLERRERKKEKGAINDRSSGGTRGL